MILIPEIYFLINQCLLQTDINLQETLIYSTIFLFNFFILHSKKGEELKNQ